MYRIKLARDRKKQLLLKRITVGGVIGSILLILVFSLYSYRHNAISKRNSPISDVTSEILQQKQDLSDISYDELDHKDDEVDQVDLGLDDNELKLPEEAEKVLNDILDVADKAIRIREQFSYTVVSGDKFSDVLEQSGILEDVSNKLVEDYPELNNLKPGQQLYWILDKDGNLEYINWLVSVTEERIYEKVSENKFKRLILEKKTTWKKEVLKGKIEGSLFSSLQKLGLDARQIVQLTKALQWQVNMRRLKKGDEFAILVYREYLNGKLTGQGNVDAIHIKTDKTSYYAIQASNGRYYNRQGETVGKTFSRYPLLRAARISSPFNPRRRHPITGRIRPHNGVDLSVPVGTPIIAPSDGIVEKVAYQGNGAGRYIVIRHGRQYQTVYMHLSRSLVKAGQNIKKGQRIALSGNTGRSTGAHLHYEFRINGRPVNPITVKLPGASSQMGNKERKSFLIRAKEAEQRLSL